MTDKPEHSSIQRSFLLSVNSQGGMRVCVLSYVWFFLTSWTITCQASLFMEFFRQKYWSGLPSPSLGDLPEPGIKPLSPVVAGGLFATVPPGKHWNSQCVCYNHSVVSDSLQPGFSVHGILQARILEWVVGISTSRGSSRPRDWTQVSCLPALACGFFNTSATWEAPGRKPSYLFLLITQHRIPFNSHRDYFLWKFPF